MKQKYFVNCFSTDGGLHEDVRIRWDKGLKISEAKEIIFEVMNISLGVKRKLHKRVVVSTITF